MNLTAVVALACAGSAGLAAVGVWTWRRLRPSPAERERRRRLALDREGRMLDAEITDLQGDVVYYSYSVRGVTYAASQDLSALRALAPSPPEMLVSPVTIKYSPRNPANSIVLCEGWSGFRKSQKRA